MSKIVPEEVVENARLKRFLTSLQEICRSPSKFKQKIDIQVSHIAYRAAQTGADVRNAMTPELIAAVILEGRVNTKHCQLGSRLELVVEGVFAALTVIKYNPIEEVIFKKVAMRVVVREGSSKHIVVTLYPLQEHDTDLKSIPEVSDHVW